MRSTGASIIRDSPHNVSGNGLNRGGLRRSRPHLNPNRNLNNWKKKRNLITIYGRCRRMKRKPQQLTINIEENYPYLYEYVKSRRDASIIRDTLKVMDEMVKKYPQIPEKYFGLSLPELVHELLEGVLSLREILSKDERMGERIYELWGYDYH